MDVWTVNMGEGCNLKKKNIDFFIVIERNFNIFLQTVNAHKSMFLFDTKSLLCGNYR